MTAQSYSSTPEWKKANKMLRAVLADTDLSKDEQKASIEHIKRKLGVSSLTHITPELLMDCAFSLFSRSPRRVAELMRRRLAEEQAQIAEKVQQAHAAKNRDLADMIASMTGTSFKPCSPGAPLPISRKTADRADADAKAHMSPATYSRHRSRRAS